MPLSKEKQDEIIKKINEAINKKGTKQIKCPICSNKEFSLTGWFTNDFLTDNFKGPFNIGGPTLPSIPLVCTNCGNTLFLNVRVLGVNEEDFKEDIKVEKKNE